MDANEEFNKRAYQARRRLMTKIGFVVAAFITVASSCSSDAQEAPKAPTEYGAVETAYSPK